MKKNLILVIMMSLTLVINGCGSKEVENKDKVIINNGQISPGVTIKKILTDYSFNDQFKKKHILTSDVKKVIFVFSKPTGHMMRVYLSTKDVNYLAKRNIDFIADVSGMPSIIFKMFALPDLKESKYPIMIIEDKKKSEIFRNEKYKNAIMIISLKNKIIQDVRFVTNEEDLKSEID